jgi:peptidoglycan/xylan/chitin deacetylase (PgdA/CDA1 family)
MSWKHGKKWVYSITYDEGCELLLEHVVPLHRKYNIPGHVALVASQIGVPRNVPGSDYNGLMILNAEQVRALCEEGWGVSCHGMTHGPITAETAYREVVEACRQLEETLGTPVTIFCVPGNNDNHPAAVGVAAEAGIRAILTIYDRVNTRDSDLLALGRVPIHSEYPPPFYSAYDPYKRLHQAMALEGWVIDYCHCPLPGRAINPRKDCTLEELEERFATVMEVAGNDVWLAEPNEVVEYIIQNRRDEAR